ncbi:hypothetical protein BGZ73_002521 [Actinomortierella ambigua]|nr:hypothetical protein BGZ73_002521 [Actinomortierella ambigua]
MTGLGQRYPTADSLSFQTTESEDDVQKWPGVAYTAKHLLTTCLGILIIIAIALTARGRPRHPHMVSDEIPESLDGVIWAAQLVVLKDMDKIRKGFLDTPNLPADPDDDTGDEDRRSGRPPHLQRRWIDSDEPMDDSAVAEDDSMDEGSGTSKPHVWSNKGVNRHGEENVPIWHLPVKSACVQATCQLDAHIDPSDNKFFAFMDPETYDIRLPKNWPSLCMSCIEISRSQFVYRTRVRLWGDLWPCLDHPIPSEARAQVMFPIGNGTTITPVSAAAAAVTTATKEVKGAAAVPDVPHHYTAPRKGIHKVSDRRKNSITSGPSTTLPSRRKGAIQTTAPGVASTGVESKKHPPAAAAAAHGSATAPRPAHRRRDVAPQDVGSAQKSPSHVPPKQTNSPHQRKQHPQEQKQQGQQGQQGQRNPPPFQHQAGHSLSESPLDDEDLASLPWLVVDPATFENLTQYESPLSLLQSNRVTAEFRFVLCED